LNTTPSTTNHDTTMAVKIHTFAFVKECANEAVLEAIQGTITYIGSRKTGEGQHGPYSFQTIALTDEKGEKLDVKLVNRPEVFAAEWKGKRVQINSTINARNNRTGLAALVEEHEGKTYQKAKATATAEMTCLDGTVSGQQVRQAVEQNLGPQGQQGGGGHAGHQTSSQQPASRPAASSGQKSELQRAKERIARLAGLQGVCYDAAVQVAHGIYERHGIAIMPGSVGIMGDKIWMEMVRKIDVDLLPMLPYQEQPFKGRPLDELIPAMRQQIGEGKAEMEFASYEKRQEIGRQHPSSVEAAPPVQPPAPQQSPHPAGAQDFRTDPAYADDDRVPF
jgi:hypothetical protein